MRAAWCFHLRETDLNNNSTDHVRHQQGFVSKILFEFFSGPTRSFRFCRVRLLQAQYHTWAHTGPHRNPPTQSVVACTGRRGASGWVWAAHWNQPSAPHHSALLRRRVARTARRPPARSPAPSPGDRPCSSPPPRSRRSRSRRRRGPPPRSSASASSPSTTTWRRPSPASTSPAAPSTVRLPFLSCSPPSSSSRSPLPRCAEFDSLRVWNARGGGGRGAGRQDLRLHPRGPEDLPPHPPGACVVPAQLLCQRPAPRLCTPPPLLRAYWCSSGAVGRV